MGLRFVETVCVLIAGVKAIIVLPVGISRGMSIVSLWLAGTSIVCSIVMRKPYHEKAKKTRGATRGNVKKKYIYKKGATESETFDKIKTNDTVAKKALDYYRTLAEKDDTEAQLNCGQC